MAWHGRPTRFPCYSTGRDRPVRRRSDPYTLKQARTADVLRNVSHTIRTINNDYNGRYGRPIVWKERAREHATGPNQTKSCSSLLFPSLSLSVGVRTKRGSPPPFLSLPLSLSPSGFPAAASAAGKVSKYEEKCDHTFITNFRPTPSRSRARERAGFSY